MSITRLGCGFPRFVTVPRVRGHRPGGVRRGDPKPHLDGCLARSPPDHSDTSEHRNYEPAGQTRRSRCSAGSNRSGDPSSRRPNRPSERDGRRVNDRAHPDSGTVAGDHRHRERSATDIPGRATRVRFRGELPLGLLRLCRSVPRSVGSTPPQVDGCGDDCDDPDHRREYVEPPVPRPLTGGT